MIEDPWGIRWRAENFLRRFSLRQIIRQTTAFVKGADYRNPVFILGVPRSGTTTLFHMLRESDEFSALATEGHNLWRSFHHPRWSNWNSDVVTHEDTLPWERRFACAFMRTRAAHHPTAERFVEKTPENSLRIAYLHRMFPDATFVVLQRNPGDVLNSLINGWRHPEGRFRSYFPPKRLHIPDYPESHQWCFALIPGWRDLTNSTIPKIALAQWISISEHLVAGRKIVPSDNWIDLSFEALIENPDETMNALSQRLDIPPNATLSMRWKEILGAPKNSLSKPGADKWRRENEADILPLLPKIRSLAAKCGYDISGDGNGVKIMARDRG
jgi:Sulfotransferase family